MNNKITITNFTGGLNCLTDRTKLGDGQYAMLNNGRTRQNKVQPTYRHKKIKLPHAGNIQAVYSQGNVLFVVVDGIAYYTTNLSSDQPNIKPVDSWTPLDATVPFIYMCAVPATTNLLARAAATPDQYTPAFNGSVAAFRECIVVQDGINTPRAILTDFSWVPLGSYESWTPEAPLYVPIGKQMAYGNAKLFVVSPTGDKIYQSVSGRPTDFVIAIDNDGVKQADASYYSIAVSYAPTNFIKAAEDGSAIAATLYGTWLLAPSQTVLYWGEPFITPIQQFPVGILNQNAAVDILGDTAFLTQSGVQSFNLTKQYRWQSNNAPLGAKISTVLDNPQSITNAAVNFNDYALFGLDTVYGPLTAIYDTMVGEYVALDNSFGQVKGFARILTGTEQQLVFVNTKNELYLAYGDTSAVNVTSVYLGDFTCSHGTAGVPDNAANNLAASGCKVTFTDLYSSGEVTVKIYADGKLHETHTKRLEANPIVQQGEVELPNNSQDTSGFLSFVFDKLADGYKLGVEVSWNCDAALEVFTLDSNTSQRQSAKLSGATNVIEPDQFAVVGNLEMSAPLPAIAVESGGVFRTNPGEWYIFNPQSSTVRMIDGNMETTKIKLFQSSGVAIFYGASTDQFTLRNVNNLHELLSAIKADDIGTIIGAGNYCYPSATDATITELFFLLGQVGLTLLGAPGDLDNVVSFKAAQGLAYPCIVSGTYTDFMLYMPYDNYYGYGVGSIQDKITTRDLAASPKRFKFFVTHKSPYTAAEELYPGSATVRLNYANKDVDGVFSAAGAVAEYIVEGGINYFTSGLGALTPDEFHPGSTLNTVFSYNASPAYYKVTVNNVQAIVTLKTATGTVVGTKIING